MRVLYVITRAEKAGAQVHLIDLVKGVQTEVAPLVATGEHGYLTQTCEQLGIPCRVVPNLVRQFDLVRDVKATEDLVKIILAENIDLVHAHTSKAGIAGRIAALRTRTPSVFTAHTWAFAERTSWKWKAIGVPAERLVARWTRRIITVSEANLKLALKYGIASPHKLITIYNGVPDVPERAVHGASQRMRIIMVARFDEQKDQATLLEAFASVRLDAELVLVGDGPTRAAAETKAAALGIARSVRFTGVRDDVAALLASSNIFVLSTKWEGFPLSILEAMRAGLPVIASDVGGVSESVVDQVTGFVMPPCRSGALAERLSWLLSSPARCTEMGNRGRERYEALFSLPQMIDKTLNVYHQVLMPKRTEPSVAH